MEFIRIKYGTEKPNALLSRGVAGIIGKALIYTLPGSVRAVSEYMTEILRTLEHAIYMQYGIDTHGKH
jgi:molybdopterin biosynthesis enzyme MoaB